MLHKAPMARKQAALSDPCGRLNRPEQPPLPQQKQGHRGPTNMVNEFLTIAVVGCRMSTRTRGIYFGKNDSQ